MLNIFKRTKENKNELPNLFPDLILGKTYYKITKPYGEKSPSIEEIKLTKYHYNTSIDIYGNKMICANFTYNGYASLDPASENIYTTRDQAVMILKQMLAEAETKKELERIAQVSEPIKSEELV